MRKLGWIVGAPLAMAALVVVLAVVTVWTGSVRIKVELPPVREASR